MRVYARPATRRAARVRREASAGFWRRKKTVPRRLPPDAENTGDLPFPVDSSRARSLRIGIVEREELAWRVHPSQTHGTGKHKTMIGEIGGVLSDYPPKIVDLERV